MAGGEVARGGVDTTEVKGAAESAGDSMMVKR